ncbi:MAG: hypothetical protein ACXW1E_09015 [Halobacteriota archaeon]
MCHFEFLLDRSLAASGLTIPTLHDTFHAVTPGSLVTGLKQSLLRVGNRKKKGLDLFQPTSLAQSLKLFKSPRKSFWDRFKRKKEKAN